LVDADGTVRTTFPAADQPAAEDRLRSWQSEEPDQERWLVSLQPVPDIRASDNQWQVTWVKSSGESMTMTVRAENEQQAIDLAKMNTPSAAMSQDIRAEREGGEPDTEPQSQTSPTVGDLNQPGPGERDFMVSWSEYRDRDGREELVNDSLRSMGATAQEAAQRLIQALRAQGRTAFSVTAVPTDPPAWRQNIAPAGEPVPGSTLDIQRQRQQAAQGEFTGTWRVVNRAGNEVYRFSGVGNSQSDANRTAQTWLIGQGDRMDDQGPFDVLPEME
jgi:hypothetical protein